MKNIRGVASGILGILCILFFLIFLSLFFSDQHSVIYAEIKSPVVISEIAAYEPDNHEWIEIYNSGDASVDVRGWTFFEGGVNHKLQLARGATSTLDAHAFAIIAEDANQFLFDYSDVTAAVFDSSWGSLNESGEEIGLKNASGEIIELFMFISATEYSLERVDMYVSDYTEKNWVEHTQGNTAGEAYDASADVEGDMGAEIELEEDNSDAGAEEPVQEEMATSTRPEDVIGGQAEIEQEKITTPTSSTIDAEKILGNSTTTEIMLVPVASTTESISTTTVEIAPVVGATSTEFVSSTNNSNQTEHQPSQNAPYEIGNIVINEFVSNPAADGIEFVELKNISNRSISVKDWYFQEASGSKTNFAGSIGAGEFYVIEKPKGSLNNAGDILYVFDSVGRIVDKLEYGTINFVAPAKGESLARNGRGEYAITTDITKGQENEFSLVTPQADKATDNSTKSLPQKKTETKPIKKSVEKEKNSVKIVEPEIIKQELNPSGKIIDENIYDVRISEFMPNPAGSDDAEFIELFNPTTHTISLYGLSIDDAEGGSKPYTIEDHIIIKSGTYMLFSPGETKIVLNNTTDEVRIFVEEAIIDRVFYENGKEDESYALIGGIWQWNSMVTPGTKNMTEENVLAVVADDVRVDAKKSTEDNKFEVIQISSLPDIEVGTLVELRGIVTVLPGVLGSQYFYIHESPEYGVEIYLYSKNFPKLSVNDTVSVRGVVTESNKKKRIKVSRKEDIRVIGAEHGVEPLEISAGDIGEAQIGNLARIIGEITDKKKNSMYVDDGSGEMIVSLKKGAQIKTDAMQKGSTITVTGIVLATKDGFTVVPRFSGDILVTEIESVTTTVKSVAEVYASPAAKQDTTGSKNALISFAAIILAGIGYAGYKLRTNFTDRR